MVSTKRVTVCRRISFSSGHRYYSPHLTEEQNREIYGSAFSSHGHGHNYVLEAYLEGPVDPHTGMVVNLKDVDSMLKAITEPLDHHFLNQDVPHFQNVVPTTENLAVYCFDQINRHMIPGQTRLKKIRLYEGQDFWIDCE